LPSSTLSLHDALPISFGNGVNCLFVNGAAGNVAPLFTVPRKTGPNDPFITDYTPMERMGELLAFETVKVAKSLTGKSDEGIIWADRKSTRLNSSHGSI